MSALDRRTRRLELGEVRHFQAEDGAWRELRDPDGPPSPRQLAALERLGMLTIVAPDPINELTKAQAAWAINWAKDNS